MNMHFFLQRPVLTVGIILAVLTVLVLSVKVAFPDLGKGSPAKVITVRANNRDVTCVVIEKRNDVPVALDCDWGSGLP